MILQSPLALAWLFLTGKQELCEKSFNRWGGVAYSGVVRGTDGNLIAAGNDSGAVRVFNMQGSGASLRNLKGHSRATKVVRWGNDGTRIFTASDDKTARWWDISTGETVVTFKDHGDYVRSAAVGPNSLCITGSYDHCVRIWDSREAAKPAMSFNHGAPVDSVLALKGGNLVLSSGSNQIKVWDTIKGGDPIASFSNSQKTITTLCQDATGTRVFSGSLDGHVKVYDVSTFEMVFGYQCPHPILSMDISIDSSRIVVGMAGGGLAVRARETKSRSSTSALSAAAAPYKASSRRYFIRGLNESWCG